MIGLDIDIDLGNLEKSLMETTRKHINAAMSDSLDDIADRLGKLFEQKMKASRTYKSIVSGVLKGDLGLDDPEIYMEDIINTIKSHIQVKYKPLTAFGSTKAIDSGISVSIIRSSYQDILSLPGSKFVSKNRFLIKWLDWLLTHGDDVIIQDYIVAHGNYPQSRSGEALMFKRAASVYRIPPQFSGLPGANFLTRALESSESDIVDIFEKSLRKYL